MPISTPWGQADSVHNVCRGVRQVSTPGHGGFMISKGYAEKHMRSAALEYGIKYGGYYCYEEDCDWAVCANELPVLRQYFADHGEDIKDIDRIILKTLSAWRADYLIACGITPLPEEYAGYLRDKKDDEMRMAKDPNLIISALSTKDKQVVRVWTADDKVHYITHASYQRHYEQKSLNLLSLCDIVEYFEGETNG
jgi:hypothetical protein